MRELVELTGVRGYTSWDDNERGCEVVSLETHEALVDDYMALGRAADALLDELREALRISYPATPVDCLLSELRECFDLSADDLISRRQFENRVAEFREAVT